jgi:glycosyltransferase involved in cell wall biosynthesis
MVICTQPLVAIFMVTYNHENYIEKAVESIVSQFTTFKYTLFIAEDCSTDNTRKICIELNQKYPAKIHLVLNSTNMGDLANSRKLLNICCQSGARYITLCEGDDYWTDPYKLQKQVDFLEINQKYTFCCTNIMVIDEIGDEQLNAWPNKSTSFSINKRSLGLNLPVPTCSLLFRVDSVLRVKGILKEISKYELADYFLKSWLLTQGKGHFFEEKMAVYRQHGGGIYTQMTERKRLKRLKKARAQLLVFCIRKGYLFSAFICLKNMLFYPNF